MEEATKIQSGILIGRNAKKIQSETSRKPFWLASAAFVGAFAVFFLRMQTTPANFISDGALMMLALACYILASVLLLTNIYAPSEMARKIGYYGAVVGVFFNLSSWLVRWVTAYDLETVKLKASGYTEMPWFFRYYPLTNLYDYGLAFAFFAVFATILLGSRKKLQFLSAFTLPLATLILTLSRFIGGEYVELPPVLDSYWRPIHVTVASLSYGVAMVCFAAAVVYLLKDKAKPEAMAIWTSIFLLGVIGTVSKFSVFFEFTYRAGLFIPNPEGAKPFSAPFRLDVPYVGAALIASSVLAVGVIVAFLIYVYQNNERAKKIGHIFLKLLFVTQILTIALLVSNVKSTTDIWGKIQAQLAQNPNQYITIGRALAERQNLSAQEIMALTPAQLELAAKQYMQAAGPNMFLSLNTNPVELVGLITALAGTFFVILFAFRTDKLRERLPSLETLDDLMYKTACLAFAGIAMLLISGAIWANESWGRPWGFDSKETGALIAWLTYAGFIHTRVSRGWTGRSSAYFAVVAFLLVIFTYLGVSYLLPGLHSYA